MICCLPKKKSLSVGVYIVCVAYQSRGLKFAESMYHVLFTKIEVLKLRSLHIMCCLPKESFKVAEFIYYMLITKEEVFKLRSVYIMCGLLKKKV